MAHRLLFLEPFYGGSHRQFVDSLRARSSWRIELLTMPPRFWRWRRRLSAFEVVRRLGEQGLSPGDFDLIVASDYVDIGDLKALWATDWNAPAAAGKSLPPILWYCHETQSTYPLPKGRTVEADVVATDMRNALHADAVAFNSEFHRQAFLAVYCHHGRLLSHWEPEWSLNSIEHKTRVLYPGIECRRPAGPESEPGAETEPRAESKPTPQQGAGRGAGPGAEGSGAPLILWNHRWEYDKNFGSFFRAATRLAARGVPFRLAILGENPQAKPQTFLRARRELAERLETFGYAKDQATYWRWLERSDIVVSTAIQENFGIAVLEAMSAGCVPLLPRRLAYPEILPEEFHETCLYESDDRLEEKLERLLTATSAALPSPQQIRRAAGRFCWEARVAEFDSWFEGALGDGSG